LIVATSDRERIQSNDAEALLGQRVGWVERSETHRNISAVSVGYGFAEPILRAILSQAVAT